MKSDIKNKNLIVIIGPGCNGKTYITARLSERYQFFSLHTDSFYHPLKGDQPSSVVGVVDDEKIKYIESQKKFLQQNNILEGSHAANTKELEIWTKHLEIDGNITIIEVQHPNFGEWLRKKHGEWARESYLIDYYNGMADIEPEVVVSSVDEVVNFLKQKDESLCVPR